MKKNNLVAILSILGVVLFFAGNIKAQQQSVVFPCVGFPQYFGVPPGVTTITTEIVGGGGYQESLVVDAGGRAAKLTADVVVTPGDVITVYTGCRSGYGFTRGGKSSAQKFYEFENLFWYKHVGGGSSAILKQNSVIAVAGGGGASGEKSFFKVRGGRGGDGIFSTGNGNNGSGISPGTGGIFGSSSSGDGGEGTNGNGTRFGGGGGGGGGYDPNGGGGAGGTGAPAGSGGGGGGGKSYTNPAFVSFSSLERASGDLYQNGYVKISYNSNVNGHVMEGCTGTQQTYTVPNQVRALIVTGIGGDGGSNATISGRLTSEPLLPRQSFGNRVQGSGSVLGYTARISVVPGEQLIYSIGCQGSLSFIGSEAQTINPGGAGGFGFYPGGSGGNGDKPPSLTTYGMGGVGGGGATGIGRSLDAPLFIAPGGGGGGGYGATDFCGGGEGGLGGGRNGGDSSPCVNNGLGGLTGGGSPNGGSGCSFCTSGGGGGGGGGYPSGSGGTAGGSGTAGGGGGGGGAFYLSPGNQFQQLFLPEERRRSSLIDIITNSIEINVIYSYTSGGETKRPLDGFLAITPVFTDFAPPVITPNVSPREPNGQNGWYRSNVNISWQVTSDLPISTQSGCLPTTIANDTTAFNSSCAATNSQGTTSGAIPTIKRDATLPTITATARDQNNSIYTFGTLTSIPVTVTFTCNDNLSGVASCPQPQTFGSSTTVTGTVVDRAGNSRTVNFGNIVSDNQPPTISPIANQETPVNSSIPSIPFTINDAETPASQLSVRISISNELLGSVGLLNDANPANKAIEFFPANGKVGTAIVTVDVFDVRGAKATRTFLVTVKCGTITIQQPPTVSYGAFMNTALFPSGGTAPYNFEQTSGLLPENIDFDEDFDSLVGGPVRALAPSSGNTQFRITDANGCSAVVPVTVNIACQINPIVSQFGDDDIFSIRGWVEGACPNSTITFDGFLNNQELSLFGSLVISKPLTIQGPGADKLTLKNVNPPGNDSNVITVGPIPGDVTISGLTIKDGNAPNAVGGGIRASANLTVKDSVITNNQAQRGGGIAMLPTDKTLSVINSTVSNNISQSSIDNDAAGILSSGTVNIVNSTISGNTHFGGNNGAAGIYAPSGLISNSTITNNLVDNTFGANNMAGGVFGGSNGLTIRSSIIAGNQNNGAFPDVVNLFTSGGFNMIGNRGSTTAFNQPTDQTGLGGSRIDPMLDILRNNGGTTPTHSFLSMLSPAIDKGSAGSFPFAEFLLPPITTDQRGIFRPYDNPNIGNANGGDGSDIGAFEIAAPSAASVDVSGRILTASGRGISRARIVLTMPSGETRTAQSNSFGYYRFTDLEAGQTYIFEVRNKQYIFSPQVLNLTEAIENLNFTAISDQ